jgi:hypothetical protein
MLTDAAFRARLRRAFGRTLAEEGLDEALTGAEVEQLRLSLAIHDALRRRRARPDPPPPDDLRERRRRRP